MRFPDSFLDDLRLRVPVIDAVKRKHKMRKAGSAEWKAVDDDSLTVNTVKNIWNDFGKGDRGGDVFEWEMFSTGCTFEQAVKNVAEFAGVPLPGNKTERRQQRSTNGSIGPEPPPAEPGDYGAPAAAAASQREITGTFDYVDADGGLIYQVVKQEWIENGRRVKTFFQRRPHGPVLEDRARQPWIVGLADGVYLRGKDGNYYAATPSRLKSEFWKNAERLDVKEPCAHTLFHLPELRIERSQPETEQRPIFICEGEKDVETLRAWGCVATTNSGGATNWNEAMAAELAGMDVVVLLDNDQAGRDRGQKIALTLRKLARSLKTLSWPDHRATCPAGGDVTDWRDQDGGDADRLFTIIDRLPPWTPEMPRTQFNALRFADLGKPRRQLQWLVKSVMQRGEMSVWFGDWGTGKSFLLTDCSFSIARGSDWFGLRTRPGLVVYQAGEGEIGFGNRMEAWRRHHRLEDGDDIPFVALPCRINLFADEADLDKLITELQAWSTFYNSIPLELFVVDTFSAATAGADENSGKDVGLVLERGRRIALATGSHVAIVHHVPKSGSTPRGWSGFLGNVDSAVLVETLENQHEEEERDGKFVRRAVHQFTVVKQKDAESRHQRQFTLPQVVIGQDAEGDAITSCIVRPFSTGSAAQEVKAAPSNYAKLNPSNADVFRSLMRAINKHGETAPVPGVPEGVRPVRIARWLDDQIELKIGYEEINEKLRAAVRKRVQRAQAEWINRGLIAKHDVWVWRTAIKVHMIDPPPHSAHSQPVRAEPEPLRAPGDPERIDDII